MAFPDPLTFFKALGIAVVIIILVLTLFYWIVWVFRRVFKGFSYWFKYSIMKKKYDEKDVAWLLDVIEKGLSEGEIMKIILLDGKKSVKHAKELLYIHRQMKKKMKGGVKRK